MEGCIIAVTDYFDSNRESDRSSLSVPVKNMVNAMYAKDYSRKQEVFREMCIKTGKVMSYNVPYGYRLCKDTGRMEINREVEMYVRMIFSWALADVPMKNIAERLCFLNVPIRSEYEGWNRKGSWEQSMVRSMVYNPAYAGFHVMGKSKVSIYRGIPSTRTDRSEWIYFPDYHEAYITMEDYQKLNEKCCQSKEKREKHLEPRKEIREMLTDCFPQMVYCGTCGRCMSFYRGTHKKGIESESFQFYRCKYNKDHKNCSHKRIQQNFLKIIVMDQIRYMVQSVCDRDGILKSIENGEIKSKALEQIQRKVMRLQEKENRLEEKLLQAYMDHTEKLLDEQDYLFIKTKLSKDKESVVSEKRETENRLKEMKLAVKAFHQHTEKVKCFLEGVEFDETLVRELISKIWVHEDGERIEVEFQCLDVFENMYVNEIIEGA